MIDRLELTSALQREVVSLIDDLRVRADEVEEVRDLIHTQWQTAFNAERTAHDVDVWREGLLAQVAVSWVLGCVFIRFCEDNALVTDPMISGPGDWRRWATDNQRDYFREHTDAGERRYLTHVFQEAAQVPGLDEVFGTHNPLWQFGPSDDAARHLINIWRATDPDTNQLIWDFTDPDWNTRFLGDLYQDLSEHAKKTFALLQTPDFVEEFILDRTLDPAIEEFGLNGPDNAGFRMIDPACGSGHFLLGAFHRLANRWLTKEPEAGRRSAAAKALDSVYGVDINPFAASIARFRLLTAALRFADVNTLADAPALNVHVAVGDSLLHGPRPGQFTSLLDEIDSQSEASKHLYETEDPERINRYLSQHYHAVVANPPYITPKDPAANAAYRDRYATCHRKYSLSVPFMERLFDLAERGTNGHPAGFVGQITANSFMKREFGKKLIENYLANDIDLTHVVDTSGAYIPGHGTPTVILFGRNRSPIQLQIRSVLGIGGEPNKPDDPRLGRVWSSIQRQIDNPGSENEYTSCSDLKRVHFSSHPWSLQGGASPDVRARIASMSTSSLGEEVSGVGYPFITGEDDAFTVHSAAHARRMGIPATMIRPAVSGEGIRSWCSTAESLLLFPYTDDGLPSDDPAVDRYLWPLRTTLRSGLFFAKTKTQRGLRWLDYAVVIQDRLREVGRAIAFANVCTANEFAPLSPGVLPQMTAPVVTLHSRDARFTRDDLLGLLNSSICAFWMKQTFHNKGSSTDSAGARISGAESWDNHIQIDSTKMKEFPLSAAPDKQWVKDLTVGAQEIASICTDLGSLRALSREQVQSLERRLARIRNEMRWSQEELDWHCLYSYGITDADLSFSPDQVFELAKGERAFEIALARRVAAGTATSTWFERHGSTPITEPPAHWPDWYRERVEQRLELIENDKFINLLERPEYKRRWNWESWDDLAHDALQKWLLTRLEDNRYWANNTPQSIAQLADIAREDTDFVQVAALYRDTTDVDLVELIAELTKADAVPYLAAWRYKDSGLRKRSVWERTWDLQRREDAGENVGKIAVPPKYASSDFRNTVYWKLRGKLDVPKERFISYPGLERDTDNTPIIGWAGWDHLQQAQALTTLYNTRRNEEAWQPEQLTPILAGLNELIPWLRQWHNDIDPLRGQGLGDYFANYLAGELQRNNTTTEQLTTWRPPTTTRGRNKKATT
ncbi:BREX-2 system adenine-specific DNA-methyltransferase PglX [Ilumatobacter coccineus]|uniref:site-specific DNA-methyltransferase (adenine-specific) n=1 Tax=Ilumatobacter coccineus (strain NBRC 103263 / KCTC 29153 / YM16-304) TaxID=1313172 RepID=A0A6C7EDJ9_ILUCY|nr:BREX-2 system adenine-specific DNA-methyltransferase PglX [Ilumatobacter coccineus]BAN04393.1 hypothetical protein YM304_40790 [Ilumatobacter coccineus YM16-304]